SERHAAELLRLGQDQVLDVLKGELASTFRLDGVVILDALDDTSPFEVMPVLHVRQIIPELPEVVDPEPWEVGVRSDLANRGRSALLADGQRSYDLAWNERERVRQLRCCQRVLELSRPIEGDPDRIEQSRSKDRIGLQCHILPARPVLFLDVSQHLWFVVGVIVELIPAKEIG